MEGGRDSRRMVQGKTWRIGGMEGRVEERERLQWRREGGRHKWQVAIHDIHVFTKSAPSHFHSSSDLFFVGKVSTDCLS